MRLMRLLLLTVVSLPMLWLMANYGTPVIAGIFLGVAWTFIMLMCAGIPFKWLMDLAKKIDHIFSLKKRQIFDIEKKARDFSEQFSWSRVIKKLERLL